MSRILLTTTRYCLTPCQGQASRLYAPPAHEGQPPEQHHVLLVLEQRAVEGRDSLLGIARLEDVERHVLVEQPLQPVGPLACRRLLLSAGNLPNPVTHVPPLPTPPLYEPGESSR